MIADIQNVNTGSGWSEYVLGKDYDRPGAYLVAGNTKLGDEICRSINYKSGDSVRMMLSFSKEDGVTPERGRQIVQEFVDKFMAGFSKDEYHVDIVEHTDTDHLHYHIRITKLNLITQTQLKLYWHKSDLEFKKALVDYVAAKHNLTTGEEHRRLFVSPEEKIERIEKWREQHKQERPDLSKKKSKAAFQERVHDIISNGIAAGLLTSLNEVKAEIEAIDESIEIVNQGHDKKKGADYVTVRQDGDDKKKIRLWGDYYGEQFWKLAQQDRAAAIKVNRSVRTREEADRPALSDAEKRLEQLTKQRVRHIEKRYGSARRKAQERSRAAAIESDQRVIEADRTRDQKATQADRPGDRPGRRAGEGEGAGRDQSQGTEERQNLSPSSPYRPNPDSGGGRMDRLPDAPEPEDPRRQNSDGARRHAMGEGERYSLSTKDPYQIVILWKVYRFKIEPPELLEGYFVKPKPSGGVRVTSPRKGVDVEDHGNRIVATGRNIEEQAKVAVALAVAKGWDLDKAEATGSPEWKEAIRREVERVKAEQERANDKNRADAIEHIRRLAESERRRAGSSRQRASSYQRRTPDNQRAAADDNRSVAEAAERRQLARAVEESVRPALRAFGEHLSGIERKLSGRAEKLVRVLRPRVEKAGRERAMQELEKFKREINIAELAQTMGYRIDKSKSTKNAPVLRNENGEKIVVGRAQDGHYTYFNVGDSSDSGSVIDFIQRRTRENLGQVRKRLRAFLNLPEWERPRPVPVATGSDLEAETAAAALIAGEEWGELKENRLPPAQVRGISWQTMQKAFERGAVVQDQDGNYHFVLHDTKKAVGIERRNKDGRGARVGEGHKKGIFTLPPAGPVEKIVVVESTIDALSARELSQKPENTLFVSTGGNMSKITSKALQRVFEQHSDAKILIATDNDRAGDLHAQKIAEMIEPGRDVARVRPIGKDWNDDLQAHRAQEAEQKRARRQMQTQTKSRGISR